MTLKPRMMMPIALALAALVPAAAMAQDWPTKEIIIYTASAEGNADITSRLIAEHADLGQPIVVVNQSSTISAQKVAQADPDGYSLLVLGSSFFLRPIFQDAPYDPVKEFVPITKISSTPNVLVVHPDMPDTVQGIIDKAKAEPGVLNYATGGSGGTAHLAAMQLLDLGGIEMERVVYSGGGPSMIGVMSNESQLSFGTPGAVNSNVEGGNLKAVAVTSLEPSPSAPGLPTIAETLPGYEATSVQGLWTTAGTPDDVVQKLNAEVARVLALPEVQQILANIGADPAPTSSADFAQQIETQITNTRRMMGLPPS